MVIGNLVAFERREVKSMNSSPRTSQAFLDGFGPCLDHWEAGRDANAVLFLLAALVFFLGVSGDCHGQRIRYFPEQREQLKAYLNATTPSLNWTMDDEFLYLRIMATTSTLQAGMFSLGPDRFEYNSFCVFLSSVSVADRGYVHWKAYAEGSKVLILYPPRNKNYILYIDCEPYFSRVYREVNAKREAALKHFAEVHRLMPDVLGLNMSFRAEDVDPCFPLLQQFPAETPSSETSSGEDSIVGQTDFGFRSPYGVASHYPVWVERWEEYYLVWRTWPLDELPEDRK